MQVIIEGNCPSRLPAIYCPVLLGMGVKLNLGTEREWQPWAAVRVFILHVILFGKVLAFSSLFLA